MLCGVCEGWLESFTTAADSLPSSLLSLHRTGVLRKSCEQRYLKRVWSSADHTRVVAKLREERQIATSYKSAHHPNGVDVCLFFSFTQGRLTSRRKKELERKKKHRLFHFIEKMKEGIIVRRHLAHHTCDQVVLQSTVSGLSPFVGHVMPGGTECHLCTPAAAAARVQQACAAARIK